MIINVLVTKADFKVVFFCFKSLKNGFCKKSLRKDEPLTSWTLFWAYLSSLVGGCNSKQTHQKVMTNMLKKVFNWSEVHLFEVTFYKIHTLGWAWIFIEKMTRAMKITYALVKDMLETVWERVLIISYIQHEISCLSFDLYMPPYSAE